MRRSFQLLRKLSVFSGRLNLSANEVSGIATLKDAIAHVRNFAKNNEGKTATVTSTTFDDNEQNQYPWH